jgi:hypothetical protein
LNQQIACLRIILNDKTVALYLNKRHYIFVTDLFISF